MLFLRLDQALELLRACKTLKETLVIRYLLFNGLSPMEVANARIEHLDPVDRILFLPRRHWKRNCVADIDRETVQHQIVYSGRRKKGPLIRSHLNCHLSREGVWHIVKRIAVATNIANKEKVSPRILKRTYAKLYLKTPGNTIGGLQKSFSHKHLWSTAHYLRFILDDVKIEKIRMMERIKGEKAKSVRLVP